MYEKKSTVRRPPYFNATSDLPYPTSACKSTHVRVVISAKHEHFDNKQDEERITPTLHKHYSSVDFPLVANKISGEVPDDGFQLLLPRDSPDNVIHLLCHMWHHWPIAMVFRQSPPVHRATQNTTKLIYQFYATIRHTVRSHL
eukprot:scpid103148/ scgid34062/ 